ncbi:MAG: MFS transporter [Gammaproteobacteria bacterium]|nr:MFS transporter [Gammaproteobacteria bacterium]
MTIIRNRYLAVASMFILNGAVFGIWASRIPAITDKHNLSPTALGLLLLVMALGAVAAFALSGRAADHYGAATVTKYIAILNSVILALIAFAPSIWMLAISMVIFGAITGGMDVAMNAWAAEVERKAQRPLMSSFHAMWSFGAGIGAGSSFLSATYYVNISTQFTSSAIVILIITLFITAIPSRSKQNKKHNNAPIYVLPKSSLLGVAIIAFCASLSEGVIADWSAIFLIAVAHVSDGDAALGYAVFSIAMMTMRLIGGQIVHQFGATKTARLAALVAMIGSLIALTFTSFSLILVGFGLTGLGLSVIMPLAFSRAANDKNVSQGAAIASVATLGYGGFLLGPPLIGFIADISSIRTSFLILPVLALLIFAFSRFLLGK